jgi:hypothetical protein
MEAIMRTITAMLLALSVVATAPPGSRPDRQEDDPQQEKMKACNAQAGDKKLEGDARKAFMSDCLKAGHPASQQDKMKACNKDASAKALKGEERKAFMSTCPGQREEVVTAAPNP